MDRIFYNGKISTLDADDTFCSAVGVKDGKIVFTGTDEEAAAFEAKERIDLKGRLLLPGFVDSHLHMLHYAFVANSVRLFDCKSVEETYAAAKARLDKREERPLNWLFCRGWNEEHFDRPVYPTKTELDALADDIPVIMVRVCGHMAVTNTCGLEKLKKIKEYPEIKNEIDEETGLLKENAVQFYYSVLDAPPAEEIEYLIKYSIADLNKAGITGIQSDDLASLPGKDWRRIMNAYKSLDSRGELNLRIYEQCLFERFEDLKTFIGEGYRTGDCGGRFTIGPVKLLHDGALGARTAADENHMQIAVHCIGDRAMDMVLTAIEKSPARADNPKNRHGIVHCQITNRRILERMAKDNVLAYIQPVFVDLDMDIVEDRIGKERMDGVDAWKSMLDLGIRTMGGSDAPVVSFDIMENIYFAVTRKNIHGKPENGWIPEEKLPVSEAVRLFTKYPAYGSYSEDVNGTVEPGKNADFVILSEDIYSVDPDRIKDIKVDMTVVAGETVYER